MRRGRLLAAAAAAVVAALALLLAHDVRAWHRTIDAAAADYAVAPKTPFPSTAATALPSGASGRLLGVRRDREWLEAVQRFVVTRDRLANQDQLGPAAYKAIHDAEAVLSRLTQDDDARRSSQAFNLLAILTFRAAYPGDTIDPGLIQQALTDLDTAVRIDGGNVQAKENLELVLRTILASHAVTIQTQGVGNHVTKLRKGGNGGPPGRGY